MVLIKHLRALEIAAGRPDPFPTPPLLCACNEVESPKKEALRQVLRRVLQLRRVLEGRLARAHKTQCKLHRNSRISEQTEEVRVCNEERTTGAGCTIILYNTVLTPLSLVTVPLLPQQQFRLLLRQDLVLHFEARRSLQRLSELAHDAGKGVTEEEVLDGVLELGKSCNRVDEFEGAIYC